MRLMEAWRVEQDSKRDHSPANNKGGWQGEAAGGHGAKPGESVAASTA